MTPDSRNNGSVTVQWQNPSDTTNTKSYTVSVSKNAGKQTSNNPLEVTISGLACGPSYDFTVTAVGPTGLTTPAKAVASRACFSPGDPTALKLSTPSGSANSLVATWTKPSNPGIGTLTYLVTVTGPNAPTSEQSVDGTSTTIGGLIPGRSYTVYVKAHTDGGTSNPATASRTVVDAAGLTINLDAVKGYYTVWGPVTCNWPNCPTWIQRTKSSYTDHSSHGDWVTTVNNGGGVDAYCYVTGGYPAHDDAGTASTIWIYVNANGHWGYASTWWFGTSVSTYGLPACSGTPPTG